ncbi:LT_GEWL domain containing protein [uncultured Caudovirales phage]|uniref:LT_GEWL domain containing protein n=1 Tax=uncultured Caudovirales phage TaxID=2100421 RepID=A0A6J5N7P9_9CAUD|nr:LT_GEWL domain containing protein [uncultured Caudovirales phage]
MDKNTLGLDSVNQSSELKEIPWETPATGELKEIPWDQPAGQPGQPGTRQRLRPVDSQTLRDLAAQEGAEHLSPVIQAIYGQESGSGATQATSVNGARGGMQVIPATFQRYAKPGERIDNPDDNMRVGVRIIKDLATKFGNNPAKIAAGYFSGEGNVNAGKGSAWKRDARDGNGKSVSGYVSDVMQRVAGISNAQAGEAQPAKPDLSKTPKWADVIAKPGFFDLPEAKRAEIKSAYFDNFIAPHTGDDRESLRAEFLAKKDEGPGMLSRAASAVGDLFKSAPSIAEGAAALPAKELPTTSRVPVERKVREAFNAQWDAATPEQRAAMARQQGIGGMLARERAGVFEQSDKLTQGSPTAAMFDPRIEARRAQLIAKGEDPRFAERAALEGARAGALPGQEIAALGGTAQKSEYDFDTKNLFDPNKDLNGLNNPLARGVAKGGLGLGKAAAGYTQFVGDVLGIDGMAESGKRVGGAISGKEGAIGERGDFGTRNLEGAINSITQQIPLLIAGVKGASEAAVLGGMAFQSFGQEYSDGRARGQDAAQATTRAAIFAAFEVIGEKFGLGNQLKALRGMAQGMPTSEIVGFLGAALKKEVPGELLTTTGQFVTDKFAPGGVALNPEATFDDYLKQVADTIAQTFMQSGLMAGGTTGVSKAVRFAKNGRDSSTVLADAARENALAKWEQGFGGKPTTANVTPDGRIEPTISGQPPITGPVEPSLGDPQVIQDAPRVEPVISTTLETSDAANSFSDQDVLDFAAAQRDSLLAKRDGTRETVVTEQGAVDQDVPGVGLSPAETQELAALEQAQGKPQALRTLYGFDQAGVQTFPVEPQPTIQETPIQETQNAEANQQGQATGPAPSPSAGRADGQPSGAVPVEGAAGQAPGAQGGAGAGERQPRVSAQAPVAPDLSGWTDDALSAQLRNAQDKTVRKAIREELAKRKAAAEAATPTAPKTEKERNQREKEQQQNGTQAVEAQQAETQGSEAPAAGADKPLVPRDTAKIFEPFDRFTVQTAQGEQEVTLSWATRPETYREVYDTDGAILNIGGITGVPYKGPTDPDSIRQFASRVVQQRAEQDEAAKPKSKPKTEKEAKAKREEAAIERGAVGMKLAAGQVVLTASGRKTTPFPNLDTSNNRKALNTVTRANRWLIENALAEAQSRGDQFNELQFQAVNNLNPSQSDKDSAEEYLFGQQPAVVPSILKPLAPKSESQAVQDFIEGKRDDAPTVEEVKAEQAAKPKTETEAKNRKSEFLDALEAARKELPAGFEIQPMRDSVSLMENGKYAVNGLSNSVAGIQEALRQAKLRAAKPAPSANTVFTEDAAEKARALLKSKLNQLNSGIDPEIMQAGITLAGYHIEKGARTFAAYAKAMIEDLGDAVRPYLKSWYMGVKYDPRATGFDGMDDAATVEAASVEKSLEDTKAKPPAAGKFDLSTPDGKFKVAQEIADFLIGDGSFKTIIEARKKISDMIGRPIEAATELAKQADEAIETGVVLAGREIVAAGRKQGRSPQVIYDRLVGLYNRQPNLSVRSSTSVRDQAYSTPVPLAYLASELAGITYDSKVLEPTAGNGMLLVGAKLENSVANELNPKRAAMLDAMGFKATTENAATGTLAAAKSQDAVIANPPFGVTKDGQGNTIIYEVKPTYGTREVDHAIAFKALATMKDDGRAVLIVGGVQSEAEEARREDYRGKSKRTFYFNLYNDYNVVDHFTVDGDLYSKQGASYPVDVIVIEGRGKSARNLPAADLPKIIRSYDELKEKLNGANGVESRADGGADGVGGRDGQAGAGDGAGLGASTGRPDNQSGAGGRAGSTGSGVRGNGPANGGRPESSGERAGAGQSQSENAPQSGDAGSAPVSNNGQKQQPGSTGRNRTNRSDSVGGTSVVAGERVESGLTDRRGEEQETETQVAYAPHSQASSVGTLVPKAMRDAIDASIQRIEDRVGDLDQYVADSLKMDADTLRANFSAEQVDALALAIDNAEAGKGFIIGDQTGIGKGRVVAAMIRYALVNGKTPIFVTEKPNLYSDMIRDLDDIGMTDDLALDTKKPRILITNGGESIPYTLIRTKNGEVTETNLTLKAPKTGKALDDMMRDMAASDSLGEYRVIFTTYSQLQTVKGKATERQRFIKQFGAGNYMIFDESHNAGGAGEQQARTKEQREAEKKGESTTTGRAAFVRQLVSNAFGTFFSSATYAKRPDVMDLYSSTNMSLAVDRPKDLGEAIKRGGVPMQQVVATMLTKDGQYIRRERTFAGVSYDTVETKVDKQTAENMASAMRSILAFSRAKEAAVKAMQKDLDKQGATVGVIAGEKSSVQGSNFGSIMHNLIDQMLLSLKVQDSVNHAIARLKAGEKVVMTVSNTMGSFLQTYAEDMGLNAGDPVALSFSDLYDRYLEKQRIVRIKRPGGESVPHRLTDDELGPSLVAMFKRIKQQIADSGFGSAPISPIDYMHAELRKAGYKTDEITGRTITLNYENGTPTLTSRSANIKQRVGAVRGFNNGDTDVLILNQAGSTGLSLHASSKFKDQRKRHMIVVQAEKNIDTHMQMLGRVHRTGQVMAPAYSQMMADIPAEMRPAAVLLKKMASLNANTTASRKSAVTAEGVVDFMNDYGGQIVHEYLRDNSEVHQAIGGSKVISIVEDPTEDASEEDIRKFTGYIPILPIAQQEEIYKDLVSRYNELLERENSLGTNKLEAKAMDLDAETIESQPITEQKESPSIFAAPAQMERVDVKRTVKPYSTAEVTDMVKERLGDKSGEQIANEAINGLVERTADYSKKTIEKLQAAESPDPVRIETARNQIDMALSIANTVLSTYGIGDTVSITDNNGQVLYGAITDISNSGRTANPAAGSDWKMQIALANGDAKSLTLSFSQLSSRYKLAKENNVNWYNAETQALEPMRVLDIFDKGATVRREKRWMVTGNILAGFAAYSGQIISYTKKDGTISQGVLMSRQFDFAKEQKSAPVRIKSADDAGKFFGATDYNAAIGTPDGLLRISSRGDTYVVTVPSSKKEGGTYFLDPGLTNAIGGDFYKSGQIMSARNVSDANMRITVEYLIKQREEKLVALTNQNDVREMFAVKADSGVGPRQFNNLAQPLPATLKVDGKDRPTRNSEGRAIHPTQEGVRNFWRWFGDSKVVDEQGRPLVVYHGTFKDFSEFNRKPEFRKQDGLDSIGSWFTTSARRAAEYGSAVMPVYLSIQSPREYASFRDLRDDWSDSQPSRGPAAKSHKTNSHWGDSEAFRDDLGLGGFDGARIKQHGDGEWKDQSAWIALNPEQVKSATGNTGEFDAERASILNDLATSPAAAFTAAPESVRANALTKLKSLERKREAGKITEAEYRLGVQQLIGKMEQRNDAREDRRMESGRRRGADWIVAQLRRGVADNTIPRNEVDFAEWMLKQNPNLANDLGIRISGKDGKGTSGNYNPLARIATLFTSANQNATAVHEILHHAERMMPVEVQAGLMKAWQRAWDASYKAGDDKLKAALDDMLAASLGDTKAHDRTPKSFANGTLNYADHYQLYSPSEFWAVNATRILSGRFEAKGSWVARAVQWFKEFVQRAKAVFGLRSDVPILKALDAVMRGDGVFQPNAKMLAERVDGASEAGELQYNDIVRNVQNNVVQFFGNQNGNLKTFGAYDKSLATQYHKALKDRDYGRVFNLSLDMQNAVSQVAIRPAELAPAILPRVDDVKSALKTVWAGKKASADLDAATKAIFAGTLAGANVMQGRVFSEEELRSRFKMTDAGVALYKQARGAIDASLDEVAASEAFAMAHGFIAKSLRVSILGNPQNAQAIIEGALSKQIRMLKAAIRAAMAAGNEQQQQQLEASLEGYVSTQRTVGKIFLAAKNLKAAGYAPLMRFGKYTVTVQAIDPTTGNLLRDENGDTITEFYGQYETQGEAIAVRNQKEALYKSREDMRVTAGTKSQTAHELYAGISPETLALFADAVGAGEAMKKYYQLALTERSALKRRLDRKGIAGFSEDMPRVLSNFITSNARFAAQRYYQRDLNNAIKFIPKEKGDVLDEAIALKKFLNDPNDPAAPVSAAMFAWFLGGSVASAIVNLTQPVLMTAPYLAQHGVGRATAAMSKAMPYALGKKQITDAELRDALKKASQEGIVDAQEIFHLYSVGAQGVATGLTNALAKLPGVGGRIKAGSESARARINAFLTLWGSMFSLAEGFNRKLTFIAAWEVAKAKGETDPYAFSVKAVNETQGVYNKVNRPNWARGPVGRTVLTFKQFSITYVELLSRMWKRGGPEGKRAALMMLAMLMLASGEEGLPFSQDLDDLIDTVGQMFGFDTNMRRNKRRLAHEILGKAGGDLFLYGASSQLPLDFAGRLGLGNLIPGTGILKPSDKELLGRNVAEVFGPAAGMAGQIADAYEAFTEGNQKKALQNLAPKAIKDILAGVEMFDKGYATDSKGRKTTDVTAGEAAIKAVGFNPTKVAELTRKTMPIQQDVAMQRRTESAILDQWVRGVTDKDQAMIEQAQARLDEWNRANPNTPIQISGAQIKSRIRNQGLNKDTRLLKAAPKEMRGRVAEGLDTLD